MLGRRYVGHSDFGLPSSFVILVSVILFRPSVLNPHPLAGSFRVMPKLQVTLPDGTQTSHELSEDVITIGRASDNMIQIDDGSVSGHHAQITAKGAEYYLTDLDSTNGTRVNGKQFVEWQLEDGDKIRFGKIDAAYASDVPATQQPLPEAEEVPVAVAASSQRPADFSNASPFKTKGKKRDPLGTAVIALSVVAMLVFAWAITMIMTLQPPQ